jgi:hypothetical protein
MESTPQEDTVAKSLKEEKIKSKANGSAPVLPSTPPIGSWPLAASRLSPDDENIL